MTEAIEIALRVQRARIEREARLRQLRGGLTLEECIRRANSIPWPRRRRWERRWGDRCR